MISLEKKRARWERLSPGERAAGQALLDGSTNTRHLAKVLGVSMGHASRLMRQVAWAMGRKIHCPLDELKEELYWFLEELKEGATT